MGYERAPNFGADVLEMASHFDPMVLEPLAKTGLAHVLEHAPRRAIGAKSSTMEDSNVLQPLHT